MWTFLFRFSLLWRNFQDIFVCYVLFRHLRWLNTLNLPQKFLVGIILTFRILWYRCFIFWCFFDLIISLFIGFIWNLR
jgi:hypothetical protein